MTNEKRDQKLDLYPVFIVFMREMERETGLIYSSSTSMCYWKGGGRIW